jgi:hypothetical protein
MRNSILTTALAILVLEVGKLRKDGVDLNELFQTLPPE